MFVNQAEKIASYVGFDTLTERWVKPNDTALPIQRGCCAVFLSCSLVCDWNYCDVVHFDKEEQSPEMPFARLMREVRCACLWMSVAVV
jgi:hypothetical protein